VAGAGALLVPSKEGTGTNALVRTPPGIFGTRFGGRSLTRHVLAAEHLRVGCEIVPNPRLAFDVDTPEDLRALAATPGATTTHREALRLGLIVERPVA
jgi:2-phospho-L-lactate guanylyltransferase